MKTISVLACDTQPIVLEGLERVLADSPDLAYAAGTPSASEVLPLVSQLRPKVVLLDQSAGLKSLLHLIASIRTASPVSQPVLWANELTDSECFRVLQAGARGIIRKNLPVTTLLECLRAVGSGALWLESSLESEAVAVVQRRGVPKLTPREREIVRLICHGLKNKEIAGSLGITPGTVKVHLMHVFEKTGVKDRFELAAQGRRLLGCDADDGVAAAAAGG